MTLRGVLLASVVLAALHAPAGAADAWDVRVMRSRGKVDIFAKGENKPEAAAFGMRLAEGDRVVTGAKAWVELSMGDKGIVRIEEKSEFEVSSADKAKALFKLNVGVLLMKAKGLVNRGRTFDIKTPRAVMAVRGTELGIAHDAKSGLSRAGVFGEGKLAVASAETPSSEVLLEPNRETQVVKDAAAEPVRLDYFRGYRAQMKELRTRVRRLQRELRRMPQQKLRRLNRRLQREAPPEEKTREQKVEEMFLEKDEEPQDEESQEETE